MNTREPRDWPLPLSRLDAWRAEMAVSGTYERRNQRIVEMRHACLSFAEIGRQIGLSREHVRSIFARHQRETRAALNHFDFSKPNVRKAAYGVWHVFDARRDWETANGQR